MKLLRATKYESKRDVHGNCYSFAELRNLLDNRKWSFCDATNLESELREVFGDWEGYREFCDYHYQCLPIRQFDKVNKGIEWGGSDIRQAIITNVKPSIYAAAKAILADIGLADQLSDHESDLYLPSIPIIDRLVAAYPECTKSRFRSNIDGKMCWDIPFQFMPFWDKVTRKANAVTE